MANATKPKEEGPEELLRVATIVLQHTIITITDREGTRSASASSGRPGSRGPRKGTRRGQLARPRRLDKAGHGREIRVCPISAGGRSRPSGPSIFPAGDQVHPDVTPFPTTAAVSPRRRV